ncbi:MAG: DsrE family protein [Campylobacterales bacterium]|nr:DsrE family protein [Campylobacterales bacterium]
MLGLSEERITQILEGIDSITTDEKEKALLAALASAQEYRAVFDCSSSNPRYILSRFNLIEKTMQMIEAHGDTVRFAVTMHGGCAKVASESADCLAPEEEVLYVKKAQESLERLSKAKTVELVVCAIALEGNGIDREDVLPYLRISENSYLDTIAYQNRGYALMPLK